MTEIAYYSFPTDIHAGPGARRKLGDALRAASVKKPMIITDRDLAELPPVAEVREVLAGALLTPEVFSGIWGNPVISQMQAGVDAFRSSGCDAIVAVGGGAALDVSKLIALMAEHPGDVLDYEDGKPDARPFDQPIPYLAAVPTTAGTGSEVGRSAVISEDESKVKRIVFSPRLLPQVVVEDAELTVGLPPKVTAATGMDALTHLIEAFIARGSHPMCDGIALEGIHMVARNLVACVEFARAAQGPTEEHLAARDAMMNAAMMGAVAFQKGLGVTHSCAHALSTVCDLHHGLANGILLPYAMAFNLAAVPDRFAMMAELAGLERASGDAFIHWLEELKEATGIPRTLSEVGVEHEHLDLLVEVAERDGCHQLNPRPVLRDDFQAIFAQALG